MPINLLSLGSYLKKKGLPCKIYDMHGKDTEYLKKVISIHKPEIIGIGAQFTPPFEDVLYLAEGIKQINPRIRIVIGGNHASSLTSLPTHIDYIVKGEGEINFYELCEDILSGKKTERIREPYPLVKDLDTLPIIDYSLVDMQPYLSYRSPFHMRHPVMGIITSRGCPNDCIYCTVKGVWGRSWRGKSPKRTVDEMELLMAIEGIEEFAILDDSASVNKVRWEAICDEIIRRKLNVKWSTPNGIAHWTLDKPLLKKMKQAGCYRITLGIESATPALRAFIGKNYPLEQAKEVIQYANKIGMWTITTNILGFPTESERNMIDTYLFSFKSGVDFATFYVLDSYPTADIYRYSTDLTLAKKLQVWYYQYWFLMKIPQAWKVFTKIRSFEDLCYTIRICWEGWRILVKSFYKKSTKGLIYG